MKPQIIEKMEAFAKAHGREDLIFRSSAVVPLELVHSSGLLDSDSAAARRPSTPVGRGRTRISGKVLGDDLPLIISLTDWEEPESLPDEIIEGILHREMKLIVGGGSKTYKSWNLMNLAVAVASGGHWIGFKCRRGKVLYVNFELHRAFCQRRLKSIASACGYTFSDLENISVWNLRGFHLDFKRFIDLLEARIGAGDYAMIILDPMYKLLGELSENSAEDVADLMNALDGLAVRCKVALVFAHHFSKGNQSKKEAMDRVSGSGVWARDPDSLMMVTRHKVEGAYAVSCILRNHPHVDDFVIEWDWPRMHRCDDLDPQQLHGSVRSSTYTPEQALEVLRAAGPEGMKTGEWKFACGREHGMSSSTFHSKMKILEDDGRILKRGGRNHVAGSDSPQDSCASQGSEALLAAAEDSDNSNLDSN